MTKFGEVGYYWFLELLVADVIMVSIDAEADVEKFCVFPTIL